MIYFICFWQWIVCKLRDYNNWFEIPINPKSFLVRPIAHFYAKYAILNFRKYNDLLLIIIKKKYYKIKYKY